MRGFAVVVGALIVLAVSAACSGAVPGSAGRAAGAAEAPSAAAPACGSSLPPLGELSSTSPPAPDTCEPPPGGGASPSCPDRPTVVADGGELRAATPADRLDGPPIAAFGRWGGVEGGPMCFSAYSDGAVMVSNGAQAVLLPPSLDPLRLAGRTDIARSAAVWGAVTVVVARVVVADPTRPDGVAADLHPVGSSTRVFVVPVSPGPVTVTALAGSGLPLATVTLG